MVYLDINLAKVAMWLYGYLPGYIDIQIISPTYLDIDIRARISVDIDIRRSAQEYTRERTIAIRQELKLHYFSQSQPIAEVDEKLTEEDQLKGYQDLCREVRIPPRDSIAECKKDLKNTLVNIVDLIDARRMGKEVKVWDDFEAFRNYTLRDEHRINMHEAKEDGGHLASLLQRLRDPRPQRRRGGRRDDRGSREFKSRRVTKNVTSSGSVKRIR